MRKKIALYFIFVLLFWVGKLLFMCYHADIYGAYPFSEWLNVLWHGLPHDLTCAGYLLALPLLLQYFCILMPNHWHAFFMRWYLRLVIFLVLIIFFCDMVLYGYWGFRLDGTALIYLQDNPGEALGQAEVWQLVVFPILICGLTYLLQRPITKLYPGRLRGAIVCMLRVPDRVRHLLFCTLLCGLCFLAIRGGVTTSTMNVGRVYYSTEMPLNQAATNPLFSFFSTIGKQKRFDKQYRFMEASKADSLMQVLNAPLGMVADSIAVETIAADTLWSHQQVLVDSIRPNIVLVILESFSGAACTGVCDDADPTIMPSVNALYQEGIGFGNLYANSFRTDRGVASIMAAYPGQPTNSVMKDQKKCNNLQYLSKRLKENNYRLHFVHGGDVNFTNMKGFLTAGGFESITGDTDFPVEDRLSKWGVPDHKMFNYLYDEIVNDDGTTGAPFFKTFLTLSSHEPFDVEYHHFDDPYVNSVAYADSCIGSFVSRLRQTPQWDNLLLIFVPDHAFARYPATIQNHELLRYRIPMVWTGGAVLESRRIETIGQQTDLAATLLGQLNIDHSDFGFSKDMLDPVQPHYAFYSFSDGFGFVMDSCAYIQDNAKSGTPLSGSDDPNGCAEQFGKAYLQTLYDDLAKR